MAQYQICTQFEDAVSVAHHFFIHGEPSTAFDWVCISEEE
ncbi:hypothetical protein JCM19237_744 [Photobacterium aphoticum]|uniref:Uncharacterized protein n=1 Tax=Photobacterium aphoticum TaxID=754436 RepID=A0A090R460_9GAMM|nr:hypothetical protein JCM19237_744 [Photobacterium aphoticum]